MAKPRSDPTGAGDGAPERSDGRRAEARGTAREKLLDVAATLFAERGYGATPVDLIAEAAGLTKGALYWHFRSKEELFLGLIEERVDGRPASIGSEREQALLAHEYWSLAVRDPALLARYRSRQRTQIDRQAARLGERLERSDEPGVPTLERLAVTMLSLVNGFAMQRIVDPPTVPPELPGEIVALLVGAVGRRASKTSEASAEVADAPERLPELFTDRSNGRDLDALMELYEPDAVFIAAGGDTIVGASAIRRHVEPIVMVQRDLEMTHRHAVAVGDLSLLSSHWRARFAPEGGPSAVVTGTSTELARRQPDGSWRYVLDAPTWAA